MGKETVNESQMSIAKMFSFTKKKSLRQLVLSSFVQAINFNMKSSVSARIWNLPKKMKVNISTSPPSKNICHRSRLAHFVTKGTLAPLMLLDGDSRTYRLYQLNRNSLDIDRSSKHKTCHRRIMSILLSLCKQWLRLPMWRSIWWVLSSCTFVFRCPEF